MHVEETQFLSSLVSGSAAGLSVDLTLYPLDTVKTRLQSADGFLKSGGLRGIYAGLGSVAVGSMPGAALFFTTYEFVKSLTKAVPEKYLFTSHIGAASTGEMVACLVRVPCEVVKQRAMVNKQASSWSVFSATIKHSGIRGLYRGYWSTVSREIPFSMIQFPLWEYLKKNWERRQGSALEAWQSSVCGAVAGGTGASFTTPLDVAKTRIMLAKHGTSLASGSVATALTQVYRENGVPGLFAGVIPRTLWISIGGAIFLGVYDKMKSLYGTALDR